MALQPLSKKKKSNWSLKEAIAELYSYITDALERGYSHEDVANLLTDKGIEMNASSLRYYLARTKPKKRRTSANANKIPKDSLVENPGEAAPAPEAIAAPATTNGKTRLTRKRGVHEVMSFLLDEPSATPDGAESGKESSDAAPESTSATKRGGRTGSNSTAKSSSSNKTGSRGQAASKRKTT